MMKWPSFSLNIFSFTLLLSMYYALVFNYHLYVKIFYSLSNPQITVFFFPLIFILVINVLFNLLNWKYFFKPFIMLLTLFSSIVFYATNKFGIIFDKNMIQNFFETNIKESYPYINFFSIAWVFVFGVIPIIFIALTNVQYPSSLKQSIKKRTLVVSCSLILTLSLSLLDNKSLAFIGRNNEGAEKLIIPFYSVISLYNYLKKTYFHPDIPYQELGLDAAFTPAHLSDKPTLLVLIIGETARSQNFSLNGYSKPTNQFTEKLGVISFHKVYSCGTSTAISIPCMFSNMNHENFDNSIARNQDGLLDILRHAGLSLLWKDNNTGCQNVCRQTPYQGGFNSYDTILLKDFSEITSKITSDRVLILHLNGSHGPDYFNRYPPNHSYFKPECRKNDVYNCNDKEIMNSYNNTILYTDYFLSLVIQKLSKETKNYNTAMIYISDHGESLGEHHLYLHGLPYNLAPDYQKIVPMIMWFSSEFYDAKKLERSCLQEKAAKKLFSHDNFFHSVLGILDIQTQEYNPQLDLFSDCRNQFG